MDAANQCPKCGYSSNNMFEECPHCGIIIAKFIERDARIEEHFSRPAEFGEPQQPYAARSNKGILIITVLIALGIWLGWLRLNRSSDSDIASTTDGGHRVSEKISDGERVELAEHLAAESYTVFVFYADW